MMAKVTLTQPEKDLLNDFSKQFGRNWKSKLREMWSTSNYDELTFKYADDQNILHSLRNRLGPHWLRSYPLQATAPKQEDTSADCGRSSYHRGIERHQAYADFESSFD
jgi:hypothetical protein